MTFDRIVSVALLLAALYAFGYAAAVVGVRLWYEAQFPYNADVPLYWTVGRGITEGFVPYRDLFETKPPGIFLLSAVSFWLTGDFRLTNVGHIASLLVVASFPLGLLSSRFLRPPSSALSRLTVWLALSSLVFVLTAYAGVNAGEVQVETYGLAGMVIYLLLIDRRGRWAFIGRACAIALAIGMKEPFLLVVPAVYLVLRTTPRRDLADLWGPLAAAGLAGTLFLALAGWLRPFFEVYLRTMVGGHVNLSGSPIQRALAFELTWGSLKEYSAYLPYVLLYTVLVYVVSGAPSREGAGPRSSVERAQVLIIALLLSWLAVGMGGTFYAHHYVLAVPVYLALIAAVLREVASGGERYWFRPGIVGLVLLLPTWVPVEELAKSARTNAAADARARRDAEVIDQALDHLKVDRYLFLGPGGHIPVPFTRHTPLGPLFFQQEAFLAPRYSKFLVSEFRKRLAEARVLVFFHHMTGPLQHEVEETMNRDFARVSKKALPKGFDYQLWVRKELGFDGLDLRSAP